MAAPKAPFTISVVPTQQTHDYVETKAVLIKAGGYESKGFGQFGGTQHALAYVKELLVKYAAQSPVVKVSSKVAPAWTELFGEAGYIPGWTAVEKTQKTPAAKAAKATDKTEKGKPSPESNPSTPKNGTVVFELSQVEQALEYAGQLQADLENKLGGAVELDISPALLSQLDQAMVEKPALHIQLNPGTQLPMTAMRVVVAGEVPQQFILPDPDEKALVHIFALQKKHEGSHHIVIHTDKKLSHKWKLILAKADLIEKWPVKLHLVKKYGKNLVVVKVIDEQANTTMIEKDVATQVQADAFMTKVMDDYDKACTFTLKVDPGAQKVFTPAPGPEPEEPVVVLTPSSLADKLQFFNDKIKSLAYPLTAAGALQFVKDSKLLVTEKDNLVGLNPDITDPEIINLLTVYAESTKVAGWYLGNFKDNTEMIEMLQAVAAVMDIEQPEHLKLIVPQKVAGSHTYWLNKFYPDHPTDKTTGAKKSPKISWVKCAEYLAKKTEAEIVTKKQEVVALVEHHLGKAHADAVAAHLQVNGVVTPVKLVPVQTPLSTYTPGADNHALSPEPAPQPTQPSDVNTALVQPVDTDAVDTSAPVVPAAHPTPVYGAPTSQVTATLKNDVIPTATIIDSSTTELPSSFKKLSGDLLFHTMIGWTGKIFRRHVKGAAFFQKVTIESQGSAGHLGGVHGKFYGHWEENGKVGPKLLIKPTSDDDSNGTIAAAEEAANEIARLANLPAAEVRRVFVKTGQYKGWGSAQLLIVDANKVMPLSTNYVNWSGLERAAVMKQHVVDMLVGDHDGHPLNYVMFGAVPVRIDRGQAGRFLGKDSISVGYNPNPAESMSAANKFYQAVKAKKAPLTEKQLRDLILPTLMAIDMITTDKYRELWRQTAELGVASQKPNGWYQFVKNAAQTQTDKGIAEAFLDIMVKRKQSLRKDFEAFFTDVLGKPFQF